MVSLSPAEKAPAGKPIKVGSPHDPAEREADRIADLLTAPEESALPVCAACAAGGAPCPACGVSAHTVRHHALGTRPAAPTSAVGRILSQSGVELPERTRHRFEQRLGTDLGGIRLHTGADAAQAAQSVHARAFSLGPHIALGSNAPSSGTAAGERLLAHEVAHVARGDHGLRRQESAVQEASSPTEAQPGQVHSLMTNADFLRAMQASRDSADGSLREAIEAERLRRNALGHAWLTPDLTETPVEFRQIFPDASGGALVGRPDPAVVMGTLIDSGGGRILSIAQFDEHLREEGIPTVLASTLTFCGSLGPPPAGAGGAISTVRARPGGPDSVPTMVADIRTAPSELNTLEVRVPQTNLPVPFLFDGRPVPGIPEELLARIRAQAPITIEELRFLLNRHNDPAIRITALVGYEDGAPRGLGSDFSTNSGLRSEGGYVFAEQDTARVGRTLIAARALEALRSGNRVMSLEVGPSWRGAIELPDGSISSDITRFHERIRDVVHGDPIPAEGSYQLNEVQMAALAAEWHGYSTPEEHHLLRRIASGDQTAIMNLRLLSPPDPRVLRYRAQMASLGIDTHPLAPLSQMASPLTPELQAEYRHGRAGAAGRSLAVGAGFGAVLALGLDASQTYGQGGDWEGFIRRSPGTVVVGGTAGGVGLATEQLLVARSSSGVMEAGMAPGLSTGMRLLGARLLSGGVGAGAAELVLIYGFERHREHDPVQEVIPRVARSSVIGAMATGAGLAVQSSTVAMIGLLLSSTAEGAAAGSVVPGWGTAIGAGVGLTAGIAAFIVLDTQLPQVEHPS